MVQTSTCEPWATIADLTGPCADYDTDTTLIGDMLQAASDVLYELSGRQFAGECDEQVVHPRQDCACVIRPYHLRHPMSLFRRALCSCDLPRVTLGMYPLVSVEEVIVAGVTLDPSEYRVENDRWLVRLADADGQWRSWPCCWDREDPEAFQVTFTAGMAPPPMGVRAAADLACQLILANQPDGAADCLLPERVQTITRQGVSVTVLDPMEFLDHGRTGIYSVDLFLSAYNPNRLQDRPVVMSPDVGPRSRRWP